MPPVVTVLTTASATHAEPANTPPRPTPTSTPGWTTRAADLRLPAQVDLEGLTEYNVTLTLRDFVAGLLEGQARIRYTNAEDISLPDVVVRLYPNTPGYNGALEIDGLRVDGTPAELTSELEGTAARILLPRALAPGEVVELAIDYRLRVPYANQAGYGALNREGDVMTLGGFYPALAVYEADHWQTDLVTGVGDPTYAEVAFFTVTVTVPSSVVVISSGRAIEKESTADGDDIWRLVGGPMRDFALVLGQSHAAITDVVDDVQVRFFYYTPGGQAVAQQVLSCACDALRAYEQLFGLYPYTELDLVQAPINASGLEYPGVVLLGPRALSQGDEWLELVVAHEVAHQWWYGLVGNDQVNAAWLDEGLASYSSILYFREIYGVDRANALMSYYYQQPYHAQSALIQQTPANLPVTYYSADNYGPVVYVHATNFFHDLHQAMGEEAFLELVQQFLVDYRYRVVDGEDFVAMAKNFDPVSADSLYLYWILGLP